MNTRTLAPPGITAELLLDIGIGMLVVCLLAAALDWWMTRDMKGDGE